MAIQDHPPGSRPGVSADAESKEIQSKEVFERFNSGVEAALGQSGLDFDAQGSQSSKIYQIRGTSKAIKLIVNPVLRSLVSVEIVPDVKTPRQTSVEGVTKDMSPEAITALIGSKLRGLGWVAEKAPQSPTEVAKTDKAVESEKEKKSVVSEIENLPGDEKLGVEKVGLLLNCQNINKAINAFLTELLKLKEPNNENDIARVEHTIRDVLLGLREVANKIRNPQEDAERAFDAARWSIMSIGRALDNELNHFDHYNPVLKQGFEGILSAVQMKQIFPQRGDPINPELYSIVGVVRQKPPGAKSQTVAQVHTRGYFDLRDKQVVKASVTIY